MNTLMTDNRAREKRLRRDRFDLSRAVHESEYTLLQRPIDPATHQPIEPDHKFVVTLGPDTFTDEKSDGPI